MHKSFSAIGEDGKRLHNERLEFLGDAILGAVIGDIVYHHFKNKQEGFLTNARSNLVNRETLGKVATEMGLDKLILRHCAQNKKHSYLEGNALEALIGAIYLDKGYKCCMKFVQKRILEKYVNIDRTAYHETNFKSKILEWGQKHKYEIHFDLVSEERDAEGNSTFFSQVRIEGIVCGEGKGFSKKESQQKACKEALRNTSKKESLLLQQIEQASQEKTKQEAQSSCRI